MESIKVTVIVPVYNAHKYVKRIVNEVLSQDYKNIELILVENGSTDDTLELIKSIAKKDQRIIAIHNDVKGTSLARKRGVEMATGKYIVFADQDDKYINKQSLSKMVNAIEEDNSQICQFGHYVKFLGVLKSLSLVERKTVYSREQFFDSEVFSIMSSWPGRFDVNVWAKIYDAEILKFAEESMTIPLCYCEDMYLNILTFCNPKVRKVSVRPEGYYIWHMGIGASGASTAGDKLFLEYRYFKPLAEKLARENSASKKTFHCLHDEVIYFYRAIINEMIEENCDESEIIKRIEKYEALEFVQNAKDYFRTYEAEELKDNEELAFLTGDYTPQEYYAHAKSCYKSRFKNTVKKRLVRIVRKVLYMGKE